MYSVMKSSLWSVVVVAPFAEGDATAELTLKHRIQTLQAERTMPAMVVLGYNWETLFPRSFPDRVCSPMTNNHMKWWF